MSHAIALSLYVNYKTTSCITCGVQIALPEAFYDQRLEDGKSYCCPNGHKQYFTQGQTEEDKLKKQLSAAIRGKDLAQRQAQTERENVRYQKRCVAAQKGARTRLINRVKNGICPCCNRTIKQLANHMKTKHPEYVVGKDLKEALKK